MNELEQLDRLLSLVEDLAREGNAYPAESRIDPMNLDKRYREMAKLSKDHILTGDDVINLETNGIDDGPITAYAEEHKAAEIGERCADLLREIRGYV